YELVVLQHLDRPALWVEVDADRKMYPLPLRERAMGLDARAVFALIGNVVHVDPPAGIDVDRDDARPSVGRIGRQGRETHPLAGFHLRVDPDPQVDDGRRREAPRVDLPQLYG